MNGWYIIDVTDGFNWLKNIIKNNQKLLNILCHQKILFFCVCMYKLVSHLLYSLQKHGKNDVEVIEYGGEI